MRTYTELDGDTATVRAGSAAEHEQLARVLLEAAGPDRKREVRGTSIGGKGFRVPLDIAKTAGLIPEAAESEPEAAAPDELGQTVADLSPDAQEFVRATSGPMVPVVVEVPGDLAEAVRRVDLPDATEEPVAEGDAKQPADPEAASEPVDAEQEPAEPKKAPARKAPAKKAAAKKAEPPADGGEG